MKAAELRTKSLSEIEKLLREWQEETRSLYRERFTSEIPNVRLARAARKKIARALTVLQEMRANEPLNAQIKKPSEKER